MTNSEVINHMIRYGGHFIRHLAVAAQYADSENLKKIKDTWPDEWKKYEAMGVPPPVYPQK